MAAPVFAKDIITATLVGLASRQPRTPAETADLILLALDQQGVAVLNPQDIDWGKCPEADGEPHHVSLDLCAGCLQYDPD